MASGENPLCSLEELRLFTSVCERHGRVAESVGFVEELVGSGLSDSKVDLAVVFEIGFSLCDNAKNGEFETIMKDKNEILIKWRAGCFKCLAASKPGQKGEREINSACALLLLDISCAVDNGRRKLQLEGSKERSNLFLTTWACVTEEMSAACLDFSHPAPVTMALLSTFSLCCRSADTVPSELCAGLAFLLLSLKKKVNFIPRFVERFVYLMAFQIPADYA